MNSGVIASSQYDGHKLELRAGNENKTLIASQLFTNGVAQIDLTNISWPANGTIDICMPENDPQFPQTPGKQIGSMACSSAGYNSSNKSCAIIWGGSQSVATELISEGCSAVTGNVYEPGGDNCAAPVAIIPAYAGGYSWAESAYMGFPALSWMEIAVGDPLMAAYQAKPSVEFVDPSPPDQSTVSGQPAFAALAEPDGDGSIDTIAFSVTDPNGIRTQLKSTPSYNGTQTLASACGIRLRCRGATDSTLTEHTL